MIKRLLMAWFLSMPFVFILCWNGGVNLVISLHFIQLAILILLASLLVIMFYALLHIRNEEKKKAKKDTIESVIDQIEKEMKK